MPAYPLEISENGRYLVDQEGKSFFLSGDSPWDIFQNVDTADARDYLDDRRDRGVNTLLVTLVADRHDSMRDRWGRWPFDMVSDFTRPNEAYWAHVDVIMQEMMERDFLVLACPTWLGHGAPIWRDSITPEAMETYGWFLANRYGQYQNLIWLLGGDRRPEPESEPGIRVLAEILNSAVPHQLITYHPGPNSPSAEFFHGARWHRLNVAYTYTPSYQQVQQEWKRGAPQTPVFLCETGYEGEGNGGVDWTAEKVRRQHWWAITSGACGHAHGSKLVWWFGPGWRDWMDRPATRDLGHLRRFFQSRSWWTLEPDLQGRFLVDGAGRPGSWDHATAAVSHEGDWGLVYIPTTRSVTVNPSILGASIDALWFDPTNGATLVIEDTLATTEQPFQPPKENSRGDGDWVLVIENTA